VRRRELFTSRDPRDRESGQATVEFALILVPLLLLVVGIIQFGIGLNYWLDMQRVANQGARWAAVNNWPPDCPRGSTSCTNAPTCKSLTRTTTTLQNTLQCQMLTAGVSGSPTIQICFPDSGSKLVGSPVKVSIQAPFKLVPIFKIGTIQLRANATMRLEQSQEAARGGLITGASASC
jgi:Flp pilus assembly protein TadG